MGFNKRILPNKEILQNMVYDYGLKVVVEQYDNVDMLMGDTESMAYFQSIVREYELGQ